MVFLKTALGQEQDPETSRFCGLDHSVRVGQGSSWLLWAPEPGSPLSACPRLFPSDEGCCDTLAIVPAPLGTHRGLFAPKAGDRGQAWMSQSQSVLLPWEPPHGS
jgi:hypothetical protein